jgi:dTDP-4-amino-4,6-dideoxygalactose transaminase
MKMRNIRLMKPYISFKEIQKDFSKVFESGIFTRGKFLEYFKDDIKSFLKAKNVFLMTSATTSLSMCLKLLKITKGDEVIISDFSWPATVNVVEDLGATPVFADVSLETYNMLPEELEKKITKRTKAVIFVDTLGNPSGIGKVKSICKKNNIPLIEDAACAIGSSVNKIKCGAISDLTCFSFHPRKLICCGEGGVITTNNSKWSKILKVKLQHGAKGFKGVGLDFIDYGYNYRFTELQSVMGIKQLKKIELIIKDRNKIRLIYIKNLFKSGFIPQKIFKNVNFNNQTIAFKVSSRQLRDGLIKFLKKNEIETTIGYYSLSNTTYYKKKYNSQQKNSKILQDTTIALPCYKRLDIKKVIKQIHLFNKTKKNINANRISYKKK